MRRQCANKKEWYMVRSGTSKPQAVMKINRPNMRVSVSGSKCLKRPCAELMGWALAVGIVKIKLIQWGASSNCFGKVQLLSIMNLLGTWKTLQNVPFKCFSCIIFIIVLQTFLIEETAKNFKVTSFFMSTLPVIHFSPYLYKRNSNFKRFIFHIKDFITLTSWYF